jgi:hypothetical protein
VVSRRCTAVCLDGSPCRAWAVHGTQPPRCAAHGGAGHRDSVPLGREIELTRGFDGDPELPEDCSIDAVIDDLYRKQVLLSDTIDQIQAAEGIALRELAHLLRIHGQNASRLGRLLRDRRALSGRAADGISGAVAQALDELSNELGTPL